ncbi:tyrosine-type recombinase/integrase [Lederbergia citrea]|uniref:tyrosine-type recombinase/integrase n=1 Tax=Lederbergia citrea TaxID=2833581 RepID=UPI002016A1C1|nr:site-specific integrase [Lederbergia citrea]
MVVEAGYNAKGRRIRRTRTIRIEDKALLKTKKKLNDYLELELAKFQMEVEAGEYIAPEKLLIKDFVKDWENKYAIKALGEQTLETYLGHIKNHILPHFGHMRVDQLKPIHLVNWLPDIKRLDGKDEPLSEGTIQYIYRVFNNIFERAEDWQIIKENPVAAVEEPKSEPKEADVYDQEEVELLLEAVQSRSFHWRIFVSLALATGLRRRELLGLEWSNVDLEKGVITINQTITRGKSGKPIIKKPKTKKTIRIISLPDSIVEELGAFQLHWKKEKMKMRDQWIEEKHEWLFCNEDGTHFYPTTPTTWWRRFINSSGIRFIRLHELRHTSATLLINQGVHAKIISKRLGHSGIRITMDTYGHALQSADEGAAEKLDAIFNRKEA